VFPATATRDVSAFVCAAAGATVLTTFVVSGGGGGGGGDGGGALAFNSACILLQPRSEKRAFTTNQTRHLNKSSISATFDSTASVGRLSGD
jgi:hypothetical protein